MWTVLPMDRRVCYATGSDYLPSYTSLHIPSFNEQQLYFFSLLLLLHVYAKRLYDKCALAHVTCSTT